MQFGLSLFSDADTDSNFTLTARHVTLGLNRLGGEWVNVVQFGQNNVLRTELYQPLDHGMRWFVSPQGELRKDGQPLWVDGTQVADYDVSEASARLDLGRVLGSWGELRAGGFYRDVKVRQQVGLQLFPDFDEQQPGGRVQLRVDTLDTVVFPRRGTDALLEYQKSESDDTGVALDRFVARWNLALSRGRNTLVLGAEAVRNQEEPASVIDLYELGGVFRLSGLARQELLGAKGGFVRAIAYRRLTVLKLGAVSSNFYAGLSGEAGNVYPDADSVTWPSLRVGGSVFVGADTPLGPVILAMGWTEPGRNRLHIQIGQRF
jgi:NTE family protein